MITAQMTAHRLILNRPLETHGMAFLTSINKETAVRPIREWNVDRDPEVIWITTRDRGEGVACHYDCQWMRDDPDYDDCDDAFTWLANDNGNHIELDEITGWRLATPAEIKRSESEEG